MSPLLNLCHEVLHDIIAQVTPYDLSSLARSCRSLNEYLKGNNLLWRDAYLNNFDVLQSEVTINWEQELKDVVRMEKILRSEQEAVKRDSQEFVAETALNFLSRANKVHDEAINIRLLTSLFESQVNRNVFLFASSLFGYTPSGEKKAGTEDQRAGPTLKARQLSAKLHTYYGTSREAVGRTRSKAAHPYARAQVYDLRNYNALNYWGPYMDDRSFDVDWEKVEALMVVLGYNLQIFRDRQEVPHGEDSTLLNAPFAGITADSYVPIPNYPAMACPASASWKYAFSGGSRGLKALIEQPSPPLDAQDPYGITGTWRRIVCFLDYNDLYDFNFTNQPLAGHPRVPITTQEAIRLITMKIRVSGIEEPGEHDGKGLPVVHFTGMSRSMHASWDPNANSKLIGSARLTPEGEVRWTTLSVFDGEARWRSESIQLGGLRSARGVIGTWFDQDYDEGGPAGPTAFWKLADDEDSERWEKEGEALAAGHYLPTFN